MPLPDAHQCCTFPGCQMTFDPDLVREPGPHNDPPGLTGWYLPEGREEDPELPLHDHTTD